MTALVIYCDASAPHHKLEGEAFAGWGAVFVKDGKAVGEASGKLPRMDSVVAELKAVRLSLEHALRARLVQGGGSVIVASDCSAVERYIGEVPRSKGREPRADLVTLAAGIRRRAERAEVELVVTWVKGHCPKAAVHGRHNARADRLAKVACGARPSDEEIRARAEAAEEAHRESMRERSRLAAEARRARGRENARIDLEWQRLKRERWQRLDRDALFAELARET